MTGENNTKVCNNKTLLYTCMLMSIVCMLSVCDVLGMEQRDDIIYLNTSCVIQQIENDPTMYQDFKNILDKDENFNVKYKKRCYCCCDTDKIDFKGITICVQNDDHPHRESFEWYIEKRFNHNTTKDRIEIDMSYNCKAYDDLDNFIIKNIKAPK